MKTTVNRGGARIEDAIACARRAGRPAIAPFLTAGFPCKDRFDAILARTASEADVVEVGVPFSDPMADGATIQRSSRIALEQGVDLAWILDRVRHAETAVPVVLMSYVNPLLAYGFDTFARDAADAGVAGLIVPDLPIEECSGIRTCLDAADIALVQLVSPATPDDRLRLIAGAARGFVYAVTVLGTTGGDVARDDRVVETLARIRAVSELPVLAGFGIRSARDVARVAPHCDGVVVGSALIECLERGEDPARFLATLRAEVPA